MKKILKKIADGAKAFWSLKWEAKIGLLFLMPPIIGVVFFFFNLFGEYMGFDYFPDSWNCVYNYYGDSYGYAATPAIPLYLGLMAIAGAYLIKGNLKK